MDRNIAIETLLLWAFESRDTDMLSALVPWDCGEAEAEETRQANKWARDTSPAKRGV